MPKLTHFRTAVWSDNISTASDMGSEVIEVDELSSRPTDYWRSWKKTANVMRLQVRQPQTAAPEDKVRI